TAGLVARSLRFYLNACCGLREDLREFQLLRDLTEQGEFYRKRIAPKLWSSAVRLLIRQPAILSLLGVPSEQINQIVKDGHSKVSSFIEKQVEATLTTIPMQHNYFWRVYINGCYSADCCPNYLKRELFQLLRSRISRIQVHTRSLADFLFSTDQRFSVFVLLD